MPDQKDTDQKNVDEQLDEMDSNIHDLQDNKCLQKSWERVKLATRRKAAREKASGKQQGE